MHIYPGHCARLFGTLLETWPRMPNICMFPLSRSDASTGCGISLLAAGSVPVKYDPKSTVAGA
jgi:hypothetical protein